MDKYIKDEKEINKVVFCSGAVWLKLQAIPTKESKHQNFALIRIEELSPFPMRQIREALMDIDFNNETEVYYVQEEHINMGSYNWCKMHIKRVMNRLGKSDKLVKYIGRGPQATMATASSKDFKATEERFMNKFKEVIGFE